jgi:hypothetical protein
MGVGTRPAIRSRGCPTIPTVVNFARQRRDSASLLSLDRQLTANRRLRPALPASLIRMRTRGRLSILVGWTNSRRS